MWCDPRNTAGGQHERTPNPAPDVMWAYDHPFGEMPDIRDYGAF